MAHHLILIFMQEKTTLYKIQRNAAAGHSLNVASFSPASSKKSHLLFCGGFHSNMQRNNANFLAQLADQNGWGFTRFDYLGHGQSDGQAEHCSLHDWLDDTLAVLDSMPSKSQQTAIENNECVTTPTHNDGKDWLIRTYLNLALFKPRWY